MKEAMKFITDTRAGEMEILTPANLFKTLRIVHGDDGQLLFTCVAPQDGWTHEKLCALELPLGDQPWADAYLGDEWVGSTEV